MKVNIPNAIGKRTKFVGSSNITSTRRFFEYCPDYYLHLIPGDDVKINLQSFSRTLPLPVPTLGKINLMYRAFFVPYSSVFRGWHDFKANTLHVYSDSSSGVLPTCRYFYEYDFVTYLIGHSDEVQAVSDFHDYDFATYTASNTKRYYKIKGAYRYAYKVFLSLGYRLTGNGYNTGSTNQMYNALPLLAFARVFVDYYFPSQFRNTAAFVSLTQIINRDVQNGNNLQLGIQDLNAIFNIIGNSCYTDSFYTDLFVRPNMPNVPFNDIVLQDISDPTNIVFGTYNQGGAADNTPFASPASGVGTAFDTFMLNAVQRLTSYFKRNQLAGSFAYERMLARFGLKIQNEYSKYIDSYEVPVNIGDVMNNSYSDLGSYAGKALGFNPNKDGFFQFTAPDFGMLLIVCTVIPEVGYVEGFDRMNFALTPYQFYEPEFDGFPQAVMKGEITTFEPISGNSFLDSHNTFAFASSYYPYKVFRDNCFGDFMLNSINSGMNAYNVYRELSQNVGYNYDYDNLHFDANFVQASDFMQYYRIFGLDGSKVYPLDPFRVRSVYSIEKFSNMRPEYDDIDFDQLQHNSSGSSTMDVSGAKLN